MTTEIDRHHRLQLTGPEIGKQQYPAVSKEQMRARNAFARVPTAEYLQLDTTLWNEIEEHHESFVSIGNLQSNLIANNIRQDHLTMNGVVVTPAEYQAIPRNIKKMQTHAVARSLGKKSLEDVDARYERSKRAGKHILETPLKKLHNFVDTYENRIEVADWMRKEVNNHWLAHTNEVTMRLNLQVVFGAVEEIIDIAALNNQLSQGDYELAQAAFYKQLVAGNKLQDKKPYWQDMIRLVKRYNLQKRNFVNNKIATIERRTR